MKPRTQGVLTPWMPGFMAVSLLPGGAAGAKGFPVPAAAGKHGR
jgi:hypothetical protein